MTIETITLHNLTSFEGEHTIDFTAEPLRSAGIFAITGDVGAGKSSLLDAICLALYGRAARQSELDTPKRTLHPGTESNTPKMPATPPHLLLRQGAKEGYARLRFALASGERYRAEWRVRREEAERFAPVEHSLYEISAKERETLIAQGTEEVVRTVGRIVGLDYDQFSHTVVLAQSSFSTFLRADAEEKRQLLEKLTGTEIYEKISFKIFELARAAQTTEERLQTELAGVSTWRLCEEDVQEFRLQAEHLDSVIRERKQRIQDIDTALRWHSDYERSRQRLEAVTNEHNLINKNYLSLHNEELLLERYDSVQPFRPLFEQIKENRATIARLQTAIAETQTEMSARNSALTEVEKRLLVAKERKNDAEEQLKLRQTDIDRGHEIEGEMKAVSQMLEEAETRFETAQKRLSERTTAFEQHRQEIDRLKKRCEALNLHRQSLAIHQTMFENFQTVTERLNHYNRETQRNEQLHLDHGRATTEHARIAAIAEDAKKQLQHLNDQLVAQRAARAVHAAAIAEQDISTLHRNHTDIVRRFVLLQQARRLWRRIAEGYDRLDTARADIERSSRAIDQSRKEYATVESETQQLQKRFLAVSKSFTLAQVQEVKLLRQNLKEGMPCPLCGSAHHPYHTEVEQVSGEQQSQLEKDYHTAEAAYEKRKSQLAQLRETIAQMEGTHRAETEAYERMLQQQQSDVEEWGHFADLDAAFAECTPTVNRHARSTTLETLIDTAKNKLDDAERLIRKFDYHADHLKDIGRQIEILDTEQSTLRRQHTDLEVNRQIAAARVETLQKNMLESDARVEQLYKDLDDMLTMSGWRDDIEAFAKQLAVVQADWQRTNADLERTDSERAVAETQEQLLGSALTELRNEVNTLRENRDRQREQLDGKKNELRRLLGEHTPATLHQALLTYLERTDEALQSVEQERETLRQQLQLLKGSIQHLDQTRRQHEELLRERTTRLDHEVACYNLEHAPLQAAELTNIFDTPREWHRLRKELDSCRNQLLLSQQIKDAAETEFMGLQALPSRPSAREEDQPDALRATRDEIKAELSRLGEQRESYAHRLRRHEESLHAAESLEQQLAQARTDAQEWRRLETAFGAPAGKKFRNMAQSFAFSLLLEHANHHLRQLAPRYALRAMKGELAFSLVDRDLLDEERPAATLSDGETFIVSLALALGLSSLSATRVDIGCLLIDEGFERLDAAALAEVLRALSSLERLQGRKVGLVSHTEQIRMLVSPQIRLEKRGAGGSTHIEVC